MERTKSSIPAASQEKQRTFQTNMEPTTDKKILVGLYCIIREWKNKWQYVAPAQVIAPIKSNYWYLVSYNTPEEGLHSHIHNLLQMKDWLFYANFNEMVDEWNADFIANKQTKE